MKIWDIVGYICQACRNGDNIRMTTHKDETIDVNPQEILIVGNCLKFNSIKVKNDDIKFIQTIQGENL